MLRTRRRPRCRRHTNAAARRMRCREVPKSTPLLHMATGCDGRAVESRLKRGGCASLHTRAQPLLFAARTSSPHALHEAGRAGQDKGGMHPSPDELCHVHSPRGHSPTQQHWPLRVTGHPPPARWTRSVAHRPWQPTACCPCPRRAEQLEQVHERLQVRVASVTACCLSSCLHKTA
jgi:hypothetical protein